MSKTRRQVREDETVSLENAIERDEVEKAYETYLDYVAQFGSGLVLRIFLEKGEGFNSGYLGEVLASEVKNYNNNLAAFLKDNYGGGLFRVVLVNPINKQFLAHLKVSIASPKNINPSTQPSYDEINRVRKEGRQEILEVANLLKTSQPQPQPNSDQSKVFETLYRIQAENNKMVVDLISASKQRELDLIEKFTSKQSDINKQLEPVLKAVSAIGEAFSKSMSIVTDAIEFARELRPEPEEPSLLGKIREGLELINSNPNLLKSFLPSPNTSNTQRETPVTPNFLKQTTEQTPNQTETKINSSPTPQNPNQTITVEQIFFASLISRIEKWFALDNPEACADDLLTDLDFLKAKGLINKEQHKNLSDFLTSADLLPYLQAQIPNFETYRPFLNELQKEYINLLNELEETPEDTKQ